VLHGTRSRNIQRCGELVIVIRRALVGVAVQHGLKAPVIVMSVRMMEMLVEGHRENRKTAHRPQKRA